MVNGKKTILYSSNHPSSRTGLARQTKALLEYLYKTGKYNIVCYAEGSPKDSVENQRFPYTIRGSLPNTQEEINQILSNYPPEQREGVSRAMGYGNFFIDQAIKEVKPDIAIFSNDVWSYPYTEKSWWKKFHTFIHATVDSFPVIEEAKKQAKNSDYYLVWMKFAERWMQEDGINNVKVLHGAVDPKPFYKKTILEKKELRQKFNIPENAMVFGFVFRNQIRKEIDPLLRAFSEFIKKHPEADPYLITHCSYSEGWNIPNLIKEYKIDNNKVLVTYVCKQCGEIDVKPFSGQDQDCKFCGVKGVPPHNENPHGSGTITCNVITGCTEDQLCCVYNLMNMYVHPTNCGGQEIPNIEALYCELPIAVCPYSFGEDFAEQPFVTSIDFTWSRQIETNFRRSIPIDFSIYKAMRKIWEMKKDKREELGKAGRRWALETFSPEVVGKQLEDFIDSLPPVDYDYNFDQPVEKNPNAQIPQIADNIEWLKKLYKEILLMDVTVEDSGMQNWLTQISRGVSRADIETFFRQTALQENNKNKPITLDDVFGNIPKEDRILFNIPESLGDCILCTALLKDLRSLYPDKKIFVATKPQYFEVFHPLVNSLIDGLIEWNQIMDNSMLMESKYVQISYCPHYLTQRLIGYLHNGQDRSNLQLCHS